MRLLLATLYVLQLGASELFIAPDGKDTNVGSKSAPFATLERARDEIRALKSAGRYPAEGITVTIAGGRYLRDHSFVLNEKDSGTAEAPIVYAAATGGHPRLIGGKVIPRSAFHPVTDEAFLHRIVSHAARRHLLQVDLKALGITDYGTLQPMHALDFGSRTHYLPAPLEVFINGHPASLARWPNRNEAHPVLGMIENAVQEMERDAKGGAVQYSTLTLKNVPANSWGSGKDGDAPAIFPQQALSHMAEWGKLDDAYVVGGLIRAYASTSRRIESFDAKQGTVRFSTPVRVWPTYKDEAKWFYFSNLPEEIDAPGEYYLDRQTGILTLYPPADFGPKSEIVVSMLNDVLVAMEGCSHVRLRGLTLEASRTSGVYIERGEANIIEGCLIRNTGIVGAQIGFGWDTGVVGEWEDAHRGETNVPAEIKAAGAGKPLPRLPGAFRHLLCTGLERLPVRLPGATAMDRQGGKNNGLKNCVIRDTGLGGVILGGGDRKTLTPAGNFVRDCDIHHNDRRLHMYAEAVMVDGCGNIVAGNYLHHNQGGLLYFLGNDHLMEFNEIAYGLTGSKDGGVVETRQNPGMLGNRLRHNYLHDNERGSLDHNAQNSTLYLDNSTHGVEVFGNVFRRNIGRTVKPFARSAIGVTEGHLHAISNNLFIDNPGVKTNDGADFAKTAATFRANLGMLTHDVDVTKPPYSLKYPEFAQLYADIITKKDATTPLFNRVFNNALIGNDEGVGPSRYPDKDYRHHNVSIDTNPGFVDEAAGDFTLRPDSRIFREIPGFAPIPFEKMQRAKALRHLSY